MKTYHYYGKGLRPMAIHDLGTLLLSLPKNLKILNESAAYNGENKTSFFQRRKDKAIRKNMWELKVRLEALKWLGFKIP